MAEHIPDRPEWTTAPSDQVAPWRRSDRARLDRARAVGDGLPEHLRAGAPALAREVRRLADLNVDGELSDAEFIAAVRAALAAP
ncbi:hypothetical protein [Candidatus Solirubrobacter pratensis]|uniref:hypothetical protein n=1 Tax=Candidatus Solirubrobacter pratensis TaxID=1298857 RepID=UPI000416BC6D|nr:hypothetical protein [Candidatus Solirubrobacter pratensis]